MRRSEFPDHLTEAQVPHGSAETYLLGRDLECRDAYRLFNSYFAIFATFFVELWQLCPHSH
jgi:hypothetical protein